MMGHSLPKTLAGDCGFGDFAILAHCGGGGAEGHGHKVSKGYFLVLCLDDVDARMTVAGAP